MRIKAKQFSNLVPLTSNRSESYVSIATNTRRSANCSTESPRFLKWFIEILTH